MAALRLEAELSDGERFSLESDESFRTHPSPLLENDLRSGETYDARLSVEGWCGASFCDDGWKNVVRVVPPRGEGRLCSASPIKTITSRNLSE